MISTDASFIASSNIYEIKSSCEKLIDETQNDIKIFKIEQLAFRDQLTEITEENDRLKKQLEVIQNSNSLFESTRDDCGVKSNGYSTNIVEMLQEEIHLFKAENDELRTIQEYLRKTIENHEKEIQSYREFVFGNDTKSIEKEKSLEFMLKLENSLAEREAQLNEKSLYIDTLESQNEMLRNEIDLIQSELKVAKMDSNHDVAMNKTRELISRATKEKFALQTSLQQASMEIAEHMEKERIALQKMGEALTIAETAFREKEEVLKTKTILEKERDFLAATIGQVMEEASQKVERQMQKMNKKLFDLQRKLEEERIESGEKIKCQMKAYNALETLLKNAQNANQELLHENEKLKRDRHAMQKALEKIGIKMHSNGNLIYEDNDDKYIIDKLKTEIQHINSKCKIAVDDITQEFQNTVSRLSSENAELKAQLRLLR